MISQNNKLDTSPRIRVIQKIYGHLMNPDEQISYNKSQYKKFIKDVTEGTIERKDLIAVSYTHLRAHETDSYLV